MTSATAVSQDEALNRLILDGAIMEALDRFYADDVVMQENNDPPTKGKAANLAREKAFVDSVQEFHGTTLHGQGSAGDVSYSEWTLDLTFKAGNRVQLHQVSARRWKDGQIVHERFYYKP